MRIFPPALASDLPCAPCSDRRSLLTVLRHKGTHFSPIAHESDKKERREMSVLRTTIIRETMEVFTNALEALMMEGR